MSVNLDRTIRAYVSNGSSLDQRLVIPGNSSQQRPKEPYASLLLVRDQRTSRPNFRQLYDDDGNPAGTLTDTQRRRDYSLQFYRSGAVDLASNFLNYIESESGILDAQTAFGSRDGGVFYITVINSGEFMTPPQITITGPGGSGAEAVAILRDGLPPQPIDRIQVTRPGEGYVENVDVAITGGDPTGNTNAIATAVGYGFVVNHPVEMLRLDELSGDALEERVVINLQIRYAVVRIDESGRVDENIANIKSG